MEISSLILQIYFALLGAYLSVVMARVLRQNGRVLKKMDEGFEKMDEKFDVLTTKMDEGFTLSRELIGKIGLETQRLIEKIDQRAEERHREVAELIAKKLGI